jgi:hypothetical protein
LISKNPSTTDSDERDWADLARHARAEGWWEWLIIAALIFEAALLWIFGCGRSATEKLSYTIANFAIAAGVYGALRSGRRAGAAGERLQRRSNDRASEAKQKAMEAEARAAPRKLTDEQIDRIAEKLRQFPDIRYDAAISAKEPEIIKLFESIHSALEKAKWKGWPWGSRSQRERYSDMLVGVGLPLDDVAVGVHTTTWRYCGLQEVTQLLADELTAAGIPNVCVRHFADQFGTSEGMSFSNAQIHILIGRRT